MTPCARSCCWVPMAGVCARQRACACHADERAPTSRNNGGTNYRDPTSQEAIRNVMRETQGRTRK